MFMIQTKGFALSTGLALAFALATPVTAQFSDVCTGLSNLCQPPTSVCSASGFRITLTNFTPAAPSDSGAASFTYQICSPPAGVCNGNARPGESCLDNNFCKKKGTVEDPSATCSRDCATDDFHALSHFDVMFPEIGASCIDSGTQVTGSCSVGNFVLGDSACLAPPGGPSFVAKCDNTPTLNPGECLTMTVNIPDEDVNLAAAVVVDKAGTNCTGSCIAGPSCADCTPPPLEGSCLTRTPGFWGTHPAITAQFLPVTVCGQTLSTTDAGFSYSATEALCVAGGKECRSNTAYVQLVRQLAAAKLNIAASTAKGGSCGEAINALITSCEGLCNASQSAISASGCIQALDAFNSSVDTLTPTPAPFNNPGPADPSQCQVANGNGVVIGKTPYCK